MATNNSVLQFLITAKDEASSAFGKFFNYLDDNTKVISGKIRDAFSNLFSPQDTSAASFEEQMQRIQSVMRASEDDFKALENAALDMGRTTRFTATEAAQGLEILAKAGFSSTEAIAALPSVLALAQGQSISMADAASYMSDTLTQFGLSADESARAASVLAKAANSANLDVNDISQSLKYVATDANLAGLSLEQTAAILDVLAKAGLRADMAGTALRDLLKDTANPASEARKAMSGLGIETNDLISVIQQLSEKGIQSSAAIQEFGIRSAGAMEILVKAGVPKIQEFTQNLIGIGDYAEQARKIMDDNLRGSIFGLQSAWEGASIALQKPVLGPLADAIRGVSDQVNQFTSSGTLQAIGEGLAEAFNAAGTAVVEFLKGFNWQTAKQDTIDAIAAIRQSLSDFSVTTGNIVSGLNILTSTVSVVWNSLTLTVKSASAIVMGAVATIGTSIESLAFGLNKVGLVSDSAFKAISDMAENSRKSVISLRDSAANDLADLGSAMGIAGKAAEDAAGKTKALADAGKNVKESLPSVELQSYITDIGFLKKRLEEAQGQQEIANSTLVDAAKRLEIANQGYRDGSISVDELKSAQSAYFTALRNSTSAGDVATETERAYRVAMDQSTTTSIDAQKTEIELAQSRKVSQSVVDDLRASYERMSSVEQDALQKRKAGIITEQEYNAIRQQAKQALDAYNTAMTRQLDQAGNALSSAIAQREAQIKLNETQVIATDIAVARAKADGDAAVYAEKLIAQTQQRIQGAVDLASKMDVEAQRAQDVANADLARYEAATKNAAIAPQAIQQLAELAAQSASAAKNKRAEADASKIKRDALLAEIDAQDIAIELISKAESLAKRSTAADQEVAQAKVEVAQKAVAVARALGDESEMRQAGNQLAAAEAELAKVVAREKRAVADAANSVVDALINQANADGIVTEQEQQGIDVALRLAEAKGILANAAESAANKTSTVSEKTKESTVSTSENTTATKENTQATDGATKSGGGLAEVVYGLIGYWRQQTAALSEATKALFEMKAGLSEGIDIGILGGLSDEAAKATQEINNATAAIQVFEKQMLYSTGSVGYFMDKVQKAGHEATKSYYEQKLAAEALEAQINNVGIASVTRFGTTTSALDSMTESVENSIKGFELLNDEDLSQIRAALDSANNKLKEMQDLTQSAKDRLSELNAEILEAQGQDKQAELLRQQLDYQQQLAEIEKQRAEAQLAGNTELLRLLDHQAAKLKTLNDLKIANIEADAKSQTATQQTTNDLNALADATGRAASGLKSMSDIDLSRVTRQTGQLVGYFNQLNGVL